MSDFLLQKRVRGKGKFLDFTSKCGKLITGGDINGSC